MLEKRFKNKLIPTQPGCYIFKNDKGEIIYVGKAKHLKKRVSSYFQNTNQDPKTAELVRRIADLDFIVTDNELEALLLEAKLIRLHRPAYNIDLKDSVRYAYLKITKEEYPRLLTTRLVEKDGAKYFGPYADGSARETTAKIARQLFKIRTCGERMPKVACLQYYIKKCDAPCVNGISREQYNENTRRAGLFLKGNTGNLLLTLGKEMKELAEKKEYELAKDRRDQINALRRLKETQKVALIRSYNEHLINYVRLNADAVLQLFTVDKGSITNKQEFRLPNQPDILESFLTQYYATNDIPDKVIVPHLLADQNVIAQYLTKVKGKLVEIVVPERGTKNKLLSMVKNNILMSVRQENPALIDLKEKLYLNALPIVIECFDISNIQDRWIVGSMVQFRGGLPDKNNYRRFKIRTVVGQDDFASMAEIVKRRYQRLKEAGEAMPDLIVIDGGKGQLGAAFNQLLELGLSLPIIGLAKKFEEIYTVGSALPLKISRQSEALKLLQRVRDEAHRFAVKYHRHVRSKEHFAPTQKD